MNSVNVNNQLDAMNYQMSMLQRDACAMKSREALQKKDVDMFHFWASASRAFERRALDSTPTQRTKRVCTEIESLRRA